MHSYETVLVSDVKWIALLAYEPIVLACVQWLSERTSMNERQRDLWQDQEKRNSNDLLSAI